MAKMDIRQAYRYVPVCLQDRVLLGMQWKNEVFLDTRLSFGLRSAPLIFTSVADVTLWVMERRGAHSGISLDDFITLGPRGQVSGEQQGDA